MKLETRWKKDKLQVSFEILRDSFLKYQKALRAARSSYFKKLITKNYHRPRTLFTVFDAVINPCVYECSAVSKTLCDDFLTFFVNKISDIRLGISCPSFDPSISKACKAEFQQF